MCIIHLHYFHESFLQLTDLKTVVETHNSTITRSLRRCTFAPLVSQTQPMTDLCVSPVSLTCRLVHSDGSLVDLSVGGAPEPQLLLEESGGQREPTEEKWMKEEDDYSCVFEKESLSDTITGTCSSSWSPSSSPQQHS